MAPTETDIAIVQLVFWVPVIPLAIWLWARCGLRLGAGAWRLVLVLGLLRIIAGSCALVAEFHPSPNIFATILSCDLIGTAPLFLVALRLLERVNDMYQKLPKVLFRAVDLVSLAGLVLGIVGANQALTHNLGDNQPFAVNAYMNAAMALFLVVLAFGLVSETVLFLPAMHGRPPRVGVSSDAAGRATRLRNNNNNNNKSSGNKPSSSSSSRTASDAERGTTTTNDANLAAQRSETSAAKKIVVAVAAATPLLVVRIIFAAIGDFRNDVRFIPYLGDRSIYLGMSVVTEIATAYICIAVGFAVGPPPPPPQKGK